MSGNQFANSNVADAGVDVGLRSHMLKTYNLIAVGLAVSAASAYAVAETPLRGMFFGADGKMTILGIVGMFAPLGLLLLASFGKIGRSLSSVRAIYWAFVALQGIGLSLLITQNANGSAAKALALAGFTFAATSLYGYTTRKNLSGMASFMVIGLIGIIIAMIVNIFLGSPAVDFAISVIGILIFAGLTAYDTQSLKENYAESHGEEALATSRYWSALSLYVNIINLVQFFRSLVSN
ncbi:Bax inhibitor-1/YccA family protein [Agrobacterium rubi]|nr:Bax inhibitor-1/YccA family protein [Agrobacterium rubi]NTF24380.1 Bax inhibitor-1/YccA family protein [Agrobacterium rubi]